MSVRAFCRLLRLFQILFEGFHQHIAEFLRWHLRPALGGIKFRETVTPAVIFLFADLAAAELLSLFCPCGQHFENGLVRCPLASIKDDMNLVPLFFGPDTMNVLNGKHGMDKAQITVNIRDAQGQGTDIWIPIILLTAMSSAENHLKGVESGADAYITKPFSPKLLLARAFQLIKQREKLRKKFSDDPGMITPAICTSEKDKQFADKLQAILEEQISNSEFAVDDLASVMGLGRSTFYRKVRGITGYSPNEYMRIIRMKKAAELLLENRYTVAEVSYKIGIEDPFYFSKCFKKQFGVSPSVYLRGKNDPDITIQTIQNDFPT